MPPETDPDPIEERRRQQEELYGDSFSDLADRIGGATGLEPRGIAGVLGVSYPMFREVQAGRRVRIGNPVAIARLGMLKEFTEALETGEASPADVPLTIQQIKSSTLRPEPVTTRRPARDAVPPPPTPAAGPQEPRRRPEEGEERARREADEASPMAEASNRTQPFAITRERLDRAREEVAAHVRPTATRRWPLLEAVTRSRTWVKHENHNPTGAFKVRGGLWLLHELKATDPDLRGLISATRGNHGQSLAFAGRAHQVPVTIVVPEGNSPDKNRAMEAYGADLVVHGEDFQEAAEHAAWLAEDRGLTMVPPFHPRLVEGVATYVAELHESVPDLDVVYVPVGMGSGICANIAVRDLLGKQTEIVGVVSELAPAYAMSFDAKAPISTGTANTFVDGVACRTPSRDAVATIVRGASRFVQVSERAAADAVRLVYSAIHNLAEPAGALALAGLLNDPLRDPEKNAAVVLTGGNCDFDILARIMADADLP